MKLDLPHYFMGFFLFCFILGIVELKLLGSFYFSPIENKGYCILNYGEGYNYFNGECYNYQDGERISISITQQEIRNYCKHPSLVSTKIFGDCWKAGKI